MILADDNLTIHGLWLGDRLTPMELLTIRSFQAQGHRFTLWRYAPLATPLPEGTVVRDAAEIIPREDVFCYRWGASRGSYAGFSDLFRYRLLELCGGWWTDMDVVCLRPFEFSDPFVFRAHSALLVTGNIIKAPRGAALMEACYLEARQTVTSHNRDWSLPMRILARHVRRLELTRHIQPPEVFAGDETVRWLVEPRSRPPASAYAVHWCQEWTRRRRFDKAHPPRGSFYHRCLVEHGLC